MEAPREEKSSAPLLSIEGLSVDIGLPAGTLHALNDVSFSVRRGETYCLVGESGCGKTITAVTIMRLLPRLAAISGGRIMFDGTDLATLSETQMSQWRGSRIGMIFQEPMTSLNPV